MFKIGSQRLTWCKVEWNGLGEDGETVKNQVMLQVELVDRDDLTAQIEAERMGGETEGFAHRVTKGWRGVGDENGKVLPFNPENFMRLYNSPGFAAAFGIRYLQAWNGQSGIREGNSEASPADGPVGEASAAESPAS